MSLEIKMTLSYFSKTVLRPVAIAMMAAVFLAGSLAQAQTPTNLQEGGSGLQIPKGSVELSSSIETQKSLGDLVTTAVNYVVGFLGFVAVVVFIYAGVLWVISLGNPEQIEKSKTMMTYAAMGLVIIIFSYTIVTFIVGVGGGPTEGQQILCDESKPCAGDSLCVGGFCYEKPQPAQKCTDSASPCKKYPQFFRCEDAVGRGACVLRPDAGVVAACDASNLCPDTHTCVAGRCKLTLGKTCSNSPEEQCAKGQQCLPDPQNPGTNLCQEPLGGVVTQCIDTADCADGAYCSGGVCVPGVDLTCKANADCEVPKQCDVYGLCRNFAANSDGLCTDNTDCPSSFVCNKDKKKCEFQGVGGTAKGGPAEGAGEANLTKIDQVLSQLSSELESMGDRIDQLSEADRKKFEEALGSGSLDDKIGRTKDLLDAATDPRAAEAAERLMYALRQFKDIRVEMDDLKDNMPQNKAILAAWTEASEALDGLIDNPTSSVKRQRYETTQRVLRELIRKFPVVQARINAVPAEANVPFTAILDGFSSLDPTGGTVAAYRWTMVDNTGTEISLGSNPVVTYEFTEPNAYVVKLRASTSQRDKDGFPTASDGVSVVRVRALPAAASVHFRINGAEVTDVYHVTQKEALIGLSFDPSPTVPAVGRYIQKYEWIFGDGAKEERTLPTTVVHTYPKPGEYNMQLITTDNLNVKDRRNIKIYIKSLAADIAVQPRDGNVNTEFRFRGVSSRADDSSIKEYRWRVEGADGTVAAESDEESFSHRFAQPGNYRAVLTVTDLTNTQDQVAKTFRIQSRPPIANFTVAIPQSNHPNRIEFSGVNSYDPDTGDHITYSWDFDGDGTFDVINGTETIATYEYKKAGDYRATLQVEDAFGKRSQTTQIVKVPSVLSADIVLSRRSARVGEEVTFSAASEAAVAYLWEFGDGQTATTEENEVKHTYQRRGKYTIKLNFFDADDNANAQTVHFLVGESDAPSSAVSVQVAGQDPELIKDLCGAGKEGIQVTRADSISLSGRDSTNTDGSSRLLDYQWVFSNGGRNSRRDFTYRFDEITPANGCFTVQLTVRDQVGGKVSLPEEVAFRVANELPQLTDFLVLPPEGAALVTPLKVRLKAVNAKDRDGLLKRYRWWYLREGRDEKLGVHVTAKPETEMVIMAQGQPDQVNRYTFVLEMTDNDGGVTDTQERFNDLATLEVKNGPNLSPVAALTVDKTTVSAGDTVSFVSKSYDPQGEALAPGDYFWDFDGDGQFDDNASGAQLNRQFNTPGEYNVRLKVTHRGLSSSATQKIVVAATNKYPQAAFTYTTEGTTVHFDGSSSRYDPSQADTTLRFEWDFNVNEDADGNGVKDDDAESTEIAPTNTYFGKEIYKAKLTVKDVLGMQGVVVRDINLGLLAGQLEKNTYRSIRLASPDQPMTILTLTLSPANLNRGETADVTATVVNADNSDYKGKVYFEVLEGSADFSPNPVEAKASKATAVFTALEKGQVRIRVRATDTVYGELSEEATLNVR